MGQSQSKTTSGQDANKDQTQPHTEASCDAGSVPGANSAATPSLGTKLFQMFSKPADDASTVTQPGSALYKSPYAPASPLPPSSSTLAQSFRNELTGGSPFEPKQNNSFFLGKVLISPRRPLREYRSSTFASATSPLVTSSSGLQAKGIVGETPNYNLQTPKSLKRKAPSPAYSNRSKVLRLEQTASPALKHLLPKTQTAQVEEQEEDVEDNQLSVPLAQTDNGGDVEVHDGVASQETSDDNVDEVDNEVALPCDDGAEENDDLPILDCNNFSTLQKIVDESSMTAPYSPSQLPKSLVSAIDISLSSMISCASPATVVLRRDSTHDDLIESDEVNDSNITTQDRNETVFQKLIDLKEYFLPAADTAMDQSNNLVTDSTQDSSVADNNLTDQPRSLPAAPDDNAVDMNSESVEDLPKEACNVSEEEEEEEAPISSDHGTPDSDLLLVEGVSNENNRNSFTSECPKTSSSSKKRSPDDIDVNLLPSACTTDSNTTSKKQWMSQYMMTESKNKSEFSGVKEASNTSEAVHMRPRCSEDAYYHYPPVLSTITSSVSNMRWPTLSMISTSSASALGISSVDLFKSLPFFNSFSNDDSTGSSQESASVAETSGVAAETSNGDAKASSPKFCEADTSAVGSTNGCLELKLADASVEEQLSDNNDDANEVPTVEKENNKSPKINNIILDSTSNTVAEPSGMSTASEQQILSPKRSRRIASRWPTTPRSSNKSSSSRNDSTSVAVSETTFLSNATPVSANRRRQRRSPSTDSNASKQSAGQNSLDSSPASSRRSNNKRKSGGSRDGSLQGESEAASQDGTQKLADDNVASSNSVESSEISLGSTAEDDSTTPSKKSNKPQSKKAKMEATLQKTVAVLRDNHTADYISNSQVLLLVRHANNSGSSGLARQLQQQFPQGSFVLSAAEKQQKRKKRGNSDSSRQVERCIMEGRSPIIVEATKGVSVVPYLFLAHSANYNTVLYNEDLYLNIKPKKNLQPSLPFCYSWFLNLTDSMELARIGKQFMSRLLAAPTCRRDLAARTHHEGSVAELLSSYIPNNIVGGPEILHCTAKGGASADPAYSAKREVMEAVGGTTTLRIVGFVLTTRTFGARVKLSSEQMLVWGNSDDPTVPKEIDQLFAEQEDITVEEGSLAGSSTAADDAKDATPLQGNGLEDSVEAADSPAQNLITKKTIKMVPLDGDHDTFCPTSGPGSRAHITLGCFSRDVHPRTAGFDLLKAIEKEQQAKKESATANGTENRTTVEESDHESDMEVDDESCAVPVKPSVASAEAGSIKADDSTSNEEKSSDQASASDGLGDSNNKGDSLASTKSVDDGAVSSVRVEGATVRCYSDGVWVVYPDQTFEVTAMFSGFHNSD